MGRVTGCLSAIGGVLAGVRVVALPGVRVVVIVGVRIVIISIVNATLARSKRGGGKNDALHGPPTSWVPPCVCPSIIPPSSELIPAHIPLERGGAGVCVSSLVRELERS